MNLHLFSTKFLFLPMAFGSVLILLTTRHASPAFYFFCCFLRGPTVRAGKILRNLYIVTSLRVQESTPRVSLFRARQSCHRCIYVCVTCHLRPALTLEAKLSSASFDLGSWIWPRNECLWKLLLEVCLCSVFCAATTTFTLFALLDIYCVGIFSGLPHLGGGGWCFFCVFLYFHLCHSSLNIPFSRQSASRSFQALLCYMGTGVGLSLLSGRMCMSLPFWNKSASGRFFKVAENQH